jgi:long-chain acyl-CoA synthetase
MDTLLRALVAAPPETLAFDDGTRRLNYGELRSEVASESNWLRTRDLPRCALLAENGCGWAIVDLSLLQLRVPNLPLPTFFTPAQMIHAIDDAGVDHVLTDRAADFIAVHPQFTLVAVSPHSGLALLQRPRSTPARELRADIVKITYTSGSTGTPKGVTLSAATLLAVAESLGTAVRTAGVQRHLCLLPLSTLIENLTAIYVPILLGAASLLPPSSRTGMHYGQFNPLALIRTVAASQAHSLVLVPELLRVLIAGCNATGGFPSLRFVAVGGAAVPRSLLTEADAIGLPVFEGYGLSECASAVCLNTPAARRAGSVGRPLSHVRLRIDESGEIHVAGAVMSGYLGDDEFAPGDSLAREIATGDIGEIDVDGYVYVRGRRRNRFITTFGRNITPEWVESALLCEPELARAMVVGEAQPFAAALLWPRPDVRDERDIAAAVARANARLPDYAQVRRWACAPDSPAELQQLLTSNGRLRRDAVLSRHGPQLDSLFTPLKL